MLWRIQVRTSRRSASNTAYSIDKCPLRSFAKNHPEAARRVLDPPPFDRALLGPFDVDSTKHEGESLEIYLKWRGWDHNIKRVLDEHNLGHEHLGSAIGLASHPLTFPLTLGRHAMHFAHKQMETSRNDATGAKLLRICCVGARAECTLPDDYWREFLVISSMGKSTNAKDSDVDVKPKFQWIIDFVGPDVPKHLQTKTISLSCEHHDITQKQHSLTMHYHTSFLHQLVLELLKQHHSKTNGTEGLSSIARLEAIRQYWEGFILFNPGIGHPNLAKSWEPTIKFLLCSKKPILLTAHSKLDAARDLKLLLHKCNEELSSHLDLEYELNPYASRMEFVDPFSIDKEPVHVVRPNQSVLLFGGKGVGT
ncbi:hypothetical protein ACHAWO_013058 [Cyclotella atomus]|uniref:Mitochondrial splicing suppressor 51-like C-terminal domain-containing protein n=1 Tax=Cyclotella atomus TaxID=382360 RepID=A0ABD3NHD2_9STRA